jgi:hypothetical protein
MYVDNAVVMESPVKRSSEAIKAEDDTVVK